MKEIIKSQAHSTMKKILPYSIIFVILSPFLNKKFHSYTQSYHENSFLLKIDYPLILEPEFIKDNYMGLYQFEIGYRRFLLERFILGGNFQYTRSNLEDPDDWRFESKLKITTPSFEIGYRANFVEQYIDLAIKTGYSTIQFSNTYQGENSVIPPTDYKLKNYSLEPTINFNYILTSKFSIIICCGSSCSSTSRSSLMRKARVQCTLPQLL